VRGLDYIKVQTDIAFDDDLEHVSDAAFRTFIEMIALSAHDLSDGTLDYSRIVKMCNSPNLDAALKELEDCKLIRIYNVKATIVGYKKYQRTKKETLRLREENRDRVMHYRSQQSKSKRESKKEEKNIVAELPVDNLVELALVELPESQSAPVDYFRTIDRYRNKLSDEHIERIIVDLANWRPKNPIDWKEKKAHLTLAKWLNKEPRDPLPPSHVPAELPEYDGTEIPIPAEIKLMLENVGRKM